MVGYPVTLVLEGRRCLVVGGGEVAARKVEGLAACGARVHVVAPSVSDSVRAVAGVTWEERSYRPDDFDEAWLAVAATDDPEVNRAVFEEGEARRVWVNGADDPQNCSFMLPSVVRRGPLTVTVSTSGRSPAFSAWFRRQLEQQIGPEYEVLVDLLASERESLKADGRSTEGLDWQKALDSDMLGLIRSGDLIHARERLQTCLSSSSSD